MKKKYFLLITFFLNISVGYGQSSFNKLYGGSNYFWQDGCLAAVQLPDSNYMVAIDSYNYGVGLGKITLLKINNNGDTLFAKYYGDSCSGDDPVTLINTPDGNLALLVVKINYCFGKEFFWLLKLNQDGDTLWTKTYASSNDITEPHSMILSKDSGFCMVGLSEFYISMSSWLDSVYTIRTDSLGNELWHRSYGNPIFDNDGRDIVVLDDGSFAITGFRFVNPNYQSMYLKIDSAGNLLKQRYYSQGGGQTVTSIVYTYDKKLLLGGSVDKNTTPPWEQAEIIKIDTAGNLIWRKEFGWQNYLNQFFDITELANLNILAVGSTDSNVWHTQGGLIVMMDSAGNVLWYKNMPPDSTFSYLGFCMETNDKGLLVSGTANDPAFVVPNNQQAWVVKLDSLGCDSTGCPFFVSGLGVAAVVAKEGLLIYPNPAEKELKIKDFKLAIKSVEVIDMIGNIMLNVEFPISNVERKINVSSLISGIYFIKVTTDMGSVVKKFIKE